MGVRLPSPPGGNDSREKAPRERLFHISLKALADGSDAIGQRFLERTEVSSINAQTACFSLKSRVLIGAHLKLNVSVPPSLLLGGPLDLYLRGRVVRVQAQPGMKSQVVTLRLENWFRFLPKLPAR